MSKYANIYDICDKSILQEKVKGKPGENLRLLYKKSVGNFFLKNFVLKGCRHKFIPLNDISKYQLMIRSAMEADYDVWKDKEWIDRTFHPIAELLDKIENTKWQIRKKAQIEKSNPNRKDLKKIITRTYYDIIRVWNKDKKDPYFPVAAQVILSGDDNMDGANFLNILKGLGSFEYQNIVMLFAFVRCFLQINPNKLKLIRKPFLGISEPMYQRVGWIWHRTAFYDANFFEHLFNYFSKNQLDSREKKEITVIMENLLRFIIVTSQEWLISPNSGKKHPSITCLPKGEDQLPLCRLSNGSWRKKRDLGFGDYVPDTDTTFLGLSMAKKWLDLVKEKKLTVDQTLLEECEKILNHPWLEIINEYQVGNGFSTNPPTIQITKPLDYFGSFPIWFHKEFKKKDGRVIRDALGNEICPGHNMDIFESILINREKWHALKGHNLKTLRNLLEFHYRAYKSGNFKNESSHKYYLPEIYVYYTARMYDVFLTLDEKEKRLLDPENKIETMRQLAIDYCANDLLAYELNPFDASLAISAIILLRYQSKNDGVIATGLKVVSDAIDRNLSKHPFKAYEWNRMRHPTRILVGSEVSTSFFVMNACVEAYHFLYGKNN